MIAFVLLASVLVSTTFASTVDCPEQLTDDCKTVSSALCTGRHMKSNWARFPCLLNNGKCVASVEECEESAESTESVLSFSSISSLDTSDISGTDDQTESASTESSTTNTFDDEKPPLP